ncbi:hypothetical protein BKA70DRAFT_1240479 [Coprinopsis sp. MPI-PUGE-AT-0042]|nr:hypothetical protein BKA70DRAFT_1240479 [Coprinopsis sp. MPI-PUGE-AT-0042]
MSFGAEALETSLTEGELQLKVIYLALIWVEALLYGTSPVLLFLPLSLHWGIRYLRAKESPEAFCVEGLCVYRLVIGFAYQLDARASLLYLNALGNWEALASPFLLAIILWTGGALVIYRCFLIWQRNYLVIAIPSLLYIVTVGLQVVNLWIWSHRRAMKKAGISSLNTPSLAALMRAIFESAAIHTAGLLVMVVLRFLDHPGWYIGHLILHPTTGIMFALMAIRVHVVQEEAKHVPRSPSLLPSWIEGRLRASHDNK